MDAINIYKYGTTLTPLFDMNKSKIGWRSKPEFQSIDELDQNPLLHKIYPE